MPPWETDALWRAGREAWPHLDLSREHFDAHLQSLGLASPPDVKHGADLFLAAACLGGVAGAHRHFARLYRSDLDAVVARLRLHEHQDEIVQRTLHSLLVRNGRRPASLAGYHGKGALRSWLKVVAVREAYNVARQHQRHRKHEVARSDDFIFDQAVSQYDPELQHLKATYRVHVKRAFEGAFSALDTQDRQLLRFAYLDGLNLDRLATIFQVSRATAHRRRREVLHRLLRTTRDRLSAELKLADAELESVMKMVRSGLQLSLVRLLESSDPPSPEATST